ncbi:alpha/beta hydrolase [Streptomyces sp. NPDC005438]|uniref:alpha/beta hydrolase family protein n=1 Tax=Streptomyces sp. NPDC005438 TaxID=3156880 RepID=UPI0033B03A84
MTPTTLRYGPHPAQLVDLYGPRPTLTVLHGGYWRERYDRSYLEPLAREFQRRGTDCALVEYRRVGGGGGWPATADDVTSALRLLAELHGPQALLGHSAGGHLALLAALRVPEAVRRVVTVAPVADLGTAHRLGLSDSAVAELLGPELESALPDADPLRLPAPTAPVTLLHGTADTDVPLAQSRSYARAKGARLLELPEVDHFAPLTPGHASFETLVGELAEENAG